VNPPLLPRNRTRMVSEVLVVPAEVAEVEETEIEEEEEPHEAVSNNKQEATALLLREARAK
jgi:hypothetical protein